MTTCPKKMLAAELNASTSDLVPSTLSKARPRAEMKLGRIFRWFRIATTKLRNMITGII
jgi:hypothetical protein